MWQTISQLAKYHVAKFIARAASVLESAGAGSVGWPAQTAIACANRWLERKEKSKRVALMYSVSSRIRHPNAPLDLS